MTETDWLASDDPGEMLRYLLEVARPRAEESGGGVPGTSDRKLRLYACAAARSTPGWRMWVDNFAMMASIRQVEAAAEACQPNHNFSDQNARNQGFFWAVCRAEEAARLMADGHGQAKAGLLRDIAGNPFRLVILPAGPPCRKCRGKGKRPSGAGGAVDRPSHRPCEVCEGTGHGPCPWLTPDVLAIAQAAYDDRDEVSGHLDPVRLLVLADSLEEVGCTEAAVLEHLRSPGPHVRGCWGIDLVLEKE